MTSYDWVIAAGFIASTATAYWYQVRYYKLVDDVIFVLSNLPECSNSNEKE